VVNAVAGKKLAGGGVRVREIGAVVEVTVIVLLFPAVSARAGTERVVLDVLTVKGLLLTVTVVEGAKALGKVSRAV
jgi:hypothetical protein